MAAWPDGEKVAQVFTDDADFIVGDGTHLKGRQEIASYFHKQVEGKDGPGWSLKGTSVTADVKNVRFLSDTVALMHTTGGILIPGEKEVPPERRGIQTWVATKAADGWPAAYVNVRIVSY